VSEIIQVLLSGFGGQGIVLAGHLLGQAGAADGKRVAVASSYGAQARGSDCASEIILSSEPIDFPHLTVADILMAMSQRGYDQSQAEVKLESGIILYDQDQVKPNESLGLRQIGIPATEYAVKRLKNGQVANIILTASLVEITKLVSLKSFRQAIRAHVSPRFQDLNLKAMQVGINLGRKVHG
jgi:2-oxoglutarate ferredoxin oxidoreductase subunit gamma